MTLDEALEHWRRERERLVDIQGWVDAGKPAAPPSLQPSLARYALHGKLAEVLALFSSSTFSSPPHTLST